MAYFSLLIAALYFVVAAAVPRNLESYSFAQYQTEFNKSYSCPVQRAAKNRIFDLNLARIRQINADYAAGRSSWFAAVNKFTDLSSEEMSRFTGLSASMRLSTRRESSFAPQLDYSNLPASVDWRSKGVVTDVKDQGGCGSCWTFSAAETLESHIAIKTGRLLTFSEQQILSCADNPQQCGGTGGCSGATQEIGFNYTHYAGGISLETSYPYQADDSPCDPSQIKPVATVDGYVKLNGNNATELQAAIAQMGPVAISLAAGDSSFQLYGGGVLSGDCSYIVNHAVVAVGYGFDSTANMGYWLVRNSWGPGWGEAGYIRIYRETDSKVPEVCGTDTAPGDGSGCAGGPPTVQVCGECGILSDSSYPIGGRLI